MDFSLYTTFPEELSSEWNALLAESIEHVPFLRHEYLSTWWELRGGGEWGADAQLTIVTARRDGQLIGIAPLFFVPDWQGKPTLLTLGAIEISDYLDIICRPADLTAFLGELLPFLAQSSGAQSADLPAWQQLDLYNLLDSSPTLPAVQQLAQSLGWKAEVEQLQHSPYIPLPGDWETYLAGIDKKQRHEIRRKMRRAESAEVPIRWYFVTDPATLDAEIEAFFGLMQQDEDKAKFLTPVMREQMHRTARCAFDAGCLSLSFMEINGEKAAGYFSLDYLNRIWVYNSGISRSANEFSPGWVLLGNLLRWANENKREAFDFMRGNEDYKYRFGGVDRFVMRARLQRP